MLVRTSVPVTTAPRPATALRRVSRAVSPYVELADAHAVQPIDGAQGTAVRMERSFSAQLLELGLRHGVEGLVRKATGHGQEQLPTSAPTDHYQRAQDNFADPHLVRWHV